MIYLILAAFLLLADLWLLGRISVQEDFSEHLSMRYQEGTISEDAFRALTESSSKEAFSMAAIWKSNGNEVVTAKNTGRREKLKWYSVKGQPEAVFGTMLCSGRYFFQDEDAACLLDQKSAQRLFGTENAVGNRMELEGKKYQVVGILSGGRMVCITPADKGSAFDGAAVCRTSSKQSVKNSIQTLEMFFGSADAVIDGQFYFSSSCILFAFNLAVLCFMICLICRVKFVSKLNLSHKTELGKYNFHDKKWGKIKNFVGRRFAKGLFLIIGGAFVILILVMGIRISGLGRDYLPTYWSDFEFYGNLWREKADAVRQLSRHQEFWQEQQIWTHWLQTVIGNTVIIAVQILAVLIIWSRHLREQSGVDNE